MPVASGNYSQQGARLTVNSLIRDPLLVRERFLQMSDGQFVMEEILRRVPGTQSGVVQYHESAPMFADDDPALVAEGAEIPLVTGSDGQPKAAYTQKFGAGIEITREARDRNRIDLVQKRMTQVRNTFVRLFENRMRSALDAVIDAADGDQTHTVASTVAGDTGARMNILEASQMVREATASSEAQQDPSFLGYEPDTMLMSTRTANQLIANEDITSIYNASPMIEKSPRYTGTLERGLLGLRVLTSRFMPDNVAYVLERNTLGGFSDERPLGVSPLYEDRPREVWRADAVRRTAIFIDEPKAVAKIEWTGE